MVTRTQGKDAKALSYVASFYLSGNVDYVKAEDYYKKAIANIFKIQERTFYFVLADWKEEESGEMFVDSELIFEIDEENLDCLRFISLFDFKREFDLELDKKDLFKTKGF